MNDMELGARYAKRRIARMEQDRLFERNMMLRQKLIGILICLLAIAGWWFLSNFYGQFEYGIMAAIFIGTGLWVLLTDRNLQREMEEEA